VLNAVTREEKSKEELQRVVLQIVQSGAMISVDSADLPARLFIVLDG
jgi:hypothetical protein